jgi:hypothetical protein
MDCAVLLPWSMNEVKPGTTLAKQTNTKAACSALLVGAFLMLACAREAGAMSTPLVLRWEQNGVHIHNGATSQTIETAFGTNLLGLAFTGTTTYDFYSPPLGASVMLTATNKGGGRICMRNTGTSATNDFSASGRMQFFDYDPATGTETLIADTAASAAKEVKHGQTVKWALGNAPLDGNTTIRAGHMIHIAMTIGLVSGDPGNSAEVLYNGPRGTSTVAFLPRNGSVLLNWALVSGVIPLPTSSAIALLHDGTARITSIGTAGGIYRIQATTSLSAPSWTTIGTNVVGTNGIAVFDDHDAANYPCRFYRLATP